MKLRKDVDFAVLRCIALLVERLRLMMVDGGTGDDPTHAISRRYLRVQNALLQGLKLEPSVGGGSMDEDRSSQHSSGQVSAVSSFV